MKKSKRAKKIILPFISKYKGHNKVLSNMESDMRSEYDSNEGSMHVLTNKEKEVIYKNLCVIKLSNFMQERVSSFDRTMITNVCDDIESDRLCRYNKRALVTIINIIREYWASTNEKIKIVDLSIS